jgi:DNA mismatch endonuclease (patch repair protein)
MKKKKSNRTEKEKRHYTMSRIKNKDTKIEILLRKALWHKGIRYRKNYKLLPGAPDIAITKYNIAIFCDGEFWHGKDWGIKKGRIRNNYEYWIPKIEPNMQRDDEVDKQLEQLGWVVIRFWGVDIQKNIDSCIETVEEIIFDIKLNRYKDFRNAEYDINI